MKYKTSQIPDFKKIAHTFKAVSNVTSEEHVGVFAERSRALFRTRVSEQQFDSFQTIPLSPAYLKRKEKAGADTRTMIATGWYLSEIRILKNRTAYGSLTTAILHDDSTRAKNMYGEFTDMLLKNVAKVQELGSANHHIPARRHWKVYLNVMHNQAPRVRIGIRNKILERLKLHYVMLPKLKVI